MTMTLYDTDYYSWCLEQAAALRRVAGERVNTSVPIDWENVAEELEDLGKSRARELRSRYVVLLLHLLKWTYQPSRRSRSWRATIVEQRDEIVQVLAENPGLKPQQEASFAVAYPSARKRAAAEIGRPLSALPEQCPFVLEQVVSDDFWPGPSA
jgi:hypothetical protein